MLQHVITNKQTSC